MKILICGDFYPSKDTDQLVKDGKTNEIFGDVTPIIADSDYSILNYESPIVNDDAKPIIKSGPHLKSSESSLSILKDSGIKCVTLANNHLLDYGEEGVKSTIKALKGSQIDYLGAGMNLDDASLTLYLYEHKIAIISCCENEFSIATENSWGCNPLDPIKQWHKIREAKERGYKVIMIIHGGYEGYQLPSPRMKETYRFFIDSGADVVINHHQHCYSGYEKYRGKMIFYGLGNFYFPKENSSNLWNEGYMVQLDLSTPDIGYRIIPYLQTSDAKIRLLTDNESTVFFKNLDSLNAIIEDESALKNHFDSWMSANDKMYQSILLPYSNKILMALWMRGLFPSFFKSKKRLAKTLNYVRCESHRDRLVKMLKEKIYN